MNSKYIHISETACCQVKATKMRATLSAILKLYVQRLLKYEASGFYCEKDTKNYYAAGSPVCHKLADDEVLNTSLV